MNVVYLLTRVLRRDSSIWDIMAHTAGSHEVTVVVVGQGVLNYSAPGLGRVSSAGAKVYALDDGSIQPPLDAARIPVSELPGVVRRSHRLISF